MTIAWYLARFRGWRSARKIRAARRQHGQHGIDSPTTRIRRIEPW